mgnify:FL=1
MNTLRATLRMAFWATFAKTALRSSENTPAPTRASPSVSNGRSKACTGSRKRSRRTADNHSARNRKDAFAGRWVDGDVESVDNILEEERHLNIQYLR